jgi:hypothetical protein
MGEFKSSYIIKFKEEDCYKIGYANKAESELESHLAKNLPDFEILDSWDGYQRDFEQRILNLVDNNYEPSNLVNPFSKKKLTKGVKLFKLKPGTTYEQVWNQAVQKKADVGTYKAVILEDGQSLKVVKGDEDVEDVVLESEVFTKDDMHAVIKQFKSKTSNARTGGKVGDGVYRFDFKAPYSDLASLQFILRPSDKNVIVERTHDGFFYARYTKYSVAPSVAGFKVVNHWISTEKEAILFKKRLARLAGGSFIRKYKSMNKDIELPVMDIHNNEIQLFIERAGDPKYDELKNNRVKKLYLLYEPLEKFYILKCSASSVWLDRLKTQYPQLKTIFVIRESKEFEKLIKANSTRYTPARRSREASIYLSEIDLDIDKCREEYEVEGAQAFLVYYPDFDLYRYRSYKNSSIELDDAKDTLGTCKVLSVKDVIKEDVDYDLLRIEELFGFEKVEAKGKYFKIPKALTQEELISSFERGCIKTINPRSKTIKEDDCPFDTEV